jgi:hypothetical protein
VKCARPYIPIPPLQACSMLTCWTVCHRSLCGRIFESKNISCSVVESAGCASDRRRGRGGACEAAARGCRRSVPAACSARRCLARKSPEHALCCCTCVSSRVPLGGFHNYIVINSNARDLRPDNSRSTLEFPEIAPSDLSARHAGCAERNGHGDGSSVRLVDRASTVSSYGMGAAYQGSNSPEPAADTRILGRLVLSEGTKSSRRAPLGKLFSRLVGRHGDF